MFQEGRTVGGREQAQDAWFDSLADVPQFRPTLLKEVLGGVASLHLSPFQHTP